MTLEGTDVGAMATWGGVGKRVDGSKVGPVTGW